jgi:hypothetical protein
MRMVLFQPLKAGYIIYSLVDLLGAVFSQEKLEFKKKLTAHCPISVLGEHDLFVN